jgi:Putative peptidoglycan binding domain
LTQLRCQGRSNGSVSFRVHVGGVTVWGVDRRSDPDDWFGDADTEEGRIPDVPSAEDDSPRADDWLDEAGDGQLRQSRFQTIDGRMVTVAASLLVLLIAGLAAAGVFSGSGPKVPTGESSRIQTAQTTTAARATTQPRRLPAPTTTLKPGDTGTQVLVMQRALASLGFSSGKPDGKYGPATKNAVARFQHSVGLTADGILGPATLHSLANALRGS